MAWQQLHFICNKTDTELAESALLDAGAVSILLEDAGDEPLFEPLPGETPLWSNVVVTAIFDTHTDFDSHTDFDAETFDVETNDNLALNNNSQNDFKQSTFKQPTFKQSTFERLASDIATLINASRFWLSQIPDKDWTREWMSHYKPIQCHNNLWIVPKWLTAPDPNAINVYLDPGLAFGTGYHASTRLCLDWLAGQSLSDKIVLDYGCGSGILGVAALLLGAKQVLAVDIDPQALLATHQNAKQNGVDSQIKTFLPAKFDHYHQAHRPAIDTITANILAKPLIGFVPQFSDILTPNGTIVLAGLIQSQVDEVLTAYRPYFKMNTPFYYDNPDDRHWYRLSGTRL